MSDNLDTARAYLAALEGNVGRVEYDCFESW
jgi:hypothetical protein